MSVHVVRCVKWQRIIARTNGQLLRNQARALHPPKNVIENKIKMKCASSYE